MRALIVTLGVLILMPNQAPAQPERFELGQRLKAFEKEWDKQTDLAARKRALAILPKVTEKFFSFQLGEAGRVLDQARWALTSDKPMPDDVAWAWSLFAEPERYLMTGDAEDEYLAVEIRPFYKMKSEQPNNLNVRFALGNQKPMTEAITKLPFQMKNPIPKAEAKTQDRPLSIIVLLGEKEIAVRSFTFTYVLDEHWRPFSDDKEEYLKSFDIKLEPESMELATAKHRVAQLVDYRKAIGIETSLPAARLIKELNETFATDPKPFFTPARPGDFWMAFPTGKEQRTPARLFVPEKLAPNKPVPLVVALHGMGGSENLFFEGYGDGQIVKLCKERGWLLVAPRCPLFGPPPVESIVKQLSERYPVDPKRVFLVGHSMGAAQSVDLVQQHPKLFAGVAFLGGGGRVKDAKAFVELPTFVGIGTKDQIAFGMAKDLNKTLTAAKASKLLYKEYEDLEHLVIVREALPDAFKMFDTVK